MQPQSGAEQKRPMNAFLLFCKRERSAVREKNPNLENRGITRILGDWWTKLDKEQKSKYTELARQHKEAFMKANPDFKWCKTQMSTTTNNNNNNNTNINNNNKNSTNNNSNEDNQSQSLNSNSSNVAANNHLQTPCKLKGNLTPNPTTSAASHASSSTSVDSLQQPANNLAISQSNPDAVSCSSGSGNGSRDSHSNKHLHQRQHKQHQLEAPKPPKKRFLERNDSIYSKASIVTQDTSSRTEDPVVPCISLDQDILDRVIDEAFSETSNSSHPSGINMCKSSNRNNNSTFTTNNLHPISTLGVASIPAFSNPANAAAAAAAATSTATLTISATSSTLAAPAATTTTSSSSSPLSYSMNVDEPVDFSMNRTINATRQQIINNLVEKMLSGPTDSETSSSSCGVPVSGASKINGQDRNVIQSVSMLKRNDLEDKR